jgi:hypothetical protein
MHGDLTGRSATAVRFRIHYAGRDLMFSKILVANRGEIAIRAMRAAYELGASTVAVFPYEDRNSMHRLKADEAYQIGEEGHPVRAYLDVAEIIRVAKLAGADAIYPGYGFLSENPDLAQAAADAGITFIGPPTKVLEMALASTPASKDLDELLAGADAIGFPIFAKAVAGGGGRGMRRVEKKEDLREALEAAMREADSAFGDPTMFLEQAVLGPATSRFRSWPTTGQRDPPVRARLQPAAPPPEGHRDRARAQPGRDAARGDVRRRGRLRPPHRLQRGHGRVPARRANGQHVFIEMNPRIQVEHTVTEEITDVDLVSEPAAHRVGGDARRPGSASSRTCVPARRRAAVPDHHRGPGQRLPAGHRHDHALPLARRCGHPAGRRHQPGRRDQRALRLDAGQADLPGPRLPDRGGQGAPGDRGVPDSRSVDEHPVPAGGSG